MATSKLDILVEAKTQAAQRNLKQLDKSIDEGRKRAAGRVGEAEKDVEAAKAARDAALKDAADAAIKAKEERDRKRSKAGSPIEALAAMASKTVGTFSASEASGFGGSSPFIQKLEALIKSGISVEKATRDNGRELRRINLEAAN